MVTIVSTGDNCPQRMWPNAHIAPHKTPVSVHFMASTENQINLLTEENKNTNNKKFPTPPTCGTHCAYRDR